MCRVKSCAGRYQRYTKYLGIDLAVLIGQTKKKRVQQPFPLPYAATLALVMVLLVVGIYLL